jgi:hypothetical protein
MMDLSWLIKWFIYGSIFVVVPFVFFLIDSLRQELDSFRQELEVSRVTIDSLRQELGVSRGITVLNTTTKSERSSPGNAARAEISLGKYSEKAVVFVSAWGSSVYNGPQANSGITLTIFRYSQPIAMSD